MPDALSCPAVRLLLASWQAAEALGLASSSRFEGGTQSMRSFVQVRALPYRKPLQP